MSFYCSHINNGYGLFNVDLLVIRSKSSFYMSHFYIQHWKCFSLYRRLSQ